MQTATPVPYYKIYVLIKRYGLHITPVLKPDRQELGVIFLYPGRVHENKDPK